jgi:predicted CoA-binding protein
MPTLLAELNLAAPHSGAGLPWPGPPPTQGNPPVTDEELRQLLLDTKVIAVVGLSANPDRPSNQVAWYLHHQGYRLFGVNPRCPEPEVFGVPMLPSLDQVPEPIDLVDVFRRPEHTPDVARAAVAAGAGALWLQLGISNPEARAIAEEAGLRYVEDRCLKVEHARLLGRSPARPTATEPRCG